MTREEIINQGRPTEPYCFETDREEQWYNLGLYDGATANPWHSVAKGELPKENGRYLTLSRTAKGYYAMIHEYLCVDKLWCAVNPQYLIKYWMEIPKLPEK